MFAGVSVFIGVQMSDGKDPALGTGRWTAAATAEPQLIRKVIVTRRVNVAGLTAAQAKKEGVKRIVVPAVRGGGSARRASR